MNLVIFKVSMRFDTLFKMRNWCCVLLGKLYQGSALAARLPISKTYNQYTQTINLYFQVNDHHSLLFPGLFVVVVGLFLHWDQTCS